MKYKFQTKILCFWVLTALIFSVMSTPCLAFYEVRPVIENEFSAAFKRKNADSMKAFAEAISQSAGSSVSDWYCLSLIRYYGGTDFSGYLNKLETAAASGNAVERQRKAIIAAAMGKTDGFVSSAAEELTGKLGIMSYAYGLILNDCTGRGTDETRIRIISEIVSSQHADGGWSLTGNSADTDVTAMILTALAPYKNDESASAAVQKGLKCLAGLQCADAGFMSYGTASCESSAQVAAALCSLGINPKSSTEFIKNGRTVLDAMNDFHLSDGGYSHTISGKQNETATVQALCALVSVWRLENGKSSFYDFLSLGEKSLTKLSDNSKTVSSAEKSVEPELQNEADSQVTESVETDFQNSELNDIKPEAQSQNETVIENEDNFLTNEADSGGRYKIYVYLAAGILLVAGLLLLAVFRRFAVKNITAVIAAAALICTANYFVDIQTPEQFYAENPKPITEYDMTAYISVRCDTVPDKSPDYIPDDGCILQSTQYALSNGETVMELLKSAARYNRIQLETDGSGYVRGIGYIYELSYGDLSGWLFTVNGESPGVGAGEYTLSDGDTVEWIYTCNLGYDVGLGGGEYE